MKTLKLFGILAMSLAFATSAMADWDFDVSGQISAVDPAKKTITISGPGGQLTVTVLPYTEIKGDDCGPFGQDIYGTFRDLTVGKFVQIEAIPYGGYNAFNNSNANAINPQTGLPQNMQLTAKEIEWKCYPRAY